MMKLNEVLSCVGAMHGRNSGAVHARKSVVRRLCMEQLEQRHVFSGVPGMEDVGIPQTAEGESVQLPPHQLDANRDGYITSIDVLHVINNINAYGSRRVDSQDPAKRYDVNRDGMVSPKDVLVTINHLNAHGAGLVAPNTAPVDQNPDAQYDVMGLGKSITFEIGVDDADADPLTFSILHPADARHITLHPENRTVTFTSRALGTEFFVIRITDGFGGVTDCRRAVNVHPASTDKIFADDRLLGEAMDVSAIR